MQQERVDIKKQLLESKARIDEVRLQNSLQERISTILKRKLEKEENSQRARVNNQQIMQTKQLSWVERWLQREERLRERTIKERSLSHERKLLEIKAKHELK